MQARQTLADIQHLLTTVLKAPTRWQGLAPFADTDGDLAAQVLDEPEREESSRLWEMIFLYSLASKLALDSFSLIRSWGRLGPAIEGTTVDRSSSMYSE